MTSTNVYTAYRAARNSGWDLVAGFKDRVGTTHPEVVAREDNLSQAEVNLLLRVHKRIKPRQKVASELGLSFDHLKIVSVAVGKVNQSLNNPGQVLEVMLRACANNTVADAAVHLKTILSKCNRPDKPSRVNRVNFAKEANENGMIHIQGVLREHDAREIQALAQSYIASSKKKYPHLQYDQLFANWMMKTLKSGGSEGEHKYQPMIIITGDPNVDYARGHVNTLSGSSIPIEEAVNLALADTGYVAHTSVKDGRAQLNFIHPIIRTRFSTGEHRLGVMLETLTCTRCGRPAITCQAHHIDAYAYVRKREHSWDDLANACAPHNAANDDNPNAPPKNGRIIRDKNGWPGYQPRPGDPISYNPRPIFYEGWRGTSHDMANNQKG